MTVLLKTLSRRAWLRAAARAAAILGLAGLGVGPFAEARAAAVGQPQPEEKIGDTIKRLFGDRKIDDGSELLKLDIPLIAENGSVVPTKVAALKPNTRERFIKSIYILADKNRRPMSAAFSFPSHVTKPSIGTNLRLGQTGNVRAVAEMSDGSLFQVVREVKVTVGGCGG
jgi:sulfur-oxidizing protein SoxY